MPDSSAAWVRRLDKDDEVLGLDRPQLVYKGLSTSKNEFRLLQIEPAENSGDPIIGRLFKASLDHFPPYDAVSYRWERTKKSHTIIINGTKFPVMENVFCFLSEFRQQSFPASPTFWIDSVCINQDSTWDRNNQVQLMGKVYSKASAVRVWIGTDSDNAEAAFNLIHRCGRADGVPDKDIVANVVRNEVGTKAITKLLQREYWNRMWVFQEIVLASRAVVHCGTLQAPWSNFRWLDNVSSKHTLWLEHQIKYQWIFEFRKAMFRIAHFCITVDQATHINNVLHPTRHLQCQDPRDKLFALLGVCKALDWIVNPDYSASVRDVFTAFAQSQMIEDGNLSAVLTAGQWSPLNGGDIKLPSWVPDLRGMGGVDIRYLAGSYVDAFDADGSAPTQHGFTLKQDDFLEQDGNNIVNVNAILFDTIQTCRPLHGIAQSDPDRKELIMTVCSLTDDGMFSMLRLRELFEGLTFADKTTLVYKRSTEWRIQERTRRLALGFYQDLCELFGPSPIFVSLLESFEQITSALGLYKSVPEMVRGCGLEQMCLNKMEYLSRAAETTDRQSTAIFTTIGGRLGIGPRCVQQEDLVAIVRGCRVPLALRQHMAYYRLVGPAYVSGIMQGEALGSYDEHGNHRSFEAIQLV
ncbi:Heterokaryon incompatibility protein 6 [Diaporthe amygdali]|uniref:Heterokaryon incompatibility protein 6 n=1 Tax=Phomopsis amygdali TaxID=1214568 RepID=UPI0022FE37EA|nr:Heterokaryon incompatibility protein 6 [Diaporthe amygdali]KAJ0103863.1 Heterokaryon incompatibility protein 6 [Diaporthe amygdali]